MPPSTPAWRGAGYSRAGLYVQKGGADTPTVPLLPHRKWRMEFQTDQFPDYDRWMTPSSTPLYQAYTLTERFSLPGTSEEEVQLFLPPLRGRDGTMYGLCGFEISQSFFKQNFAQPTGFDHLICLLAPADSGLNASAALSSGTTGGYFHAPRDMLVLRSMGGSLTQLIGSDSAYAGISELCRLSENQSYRLAVCIPMTDYRRLIFSGNLQMLLIGLFILFFVVFCCMYFHQHILSPAFRCTFVVPLAYKNTPFPKQYTILSNKWGAVHINIGVFILFYDRTRYLYRDIFITQPKDSRFCFFKASA